MNTSAPDPDGRKLMVPDYAGTMTNSAEAFPAAVLWDMDGTLVDTEPYWITAETELMNAHGPAWPGRMNALCPRLGWLLDEVGRRLPCRSPLGQGRNPGRHRAVLDHCRDRTDERTRPVRVRGAGPRIRRQRAADPGDDDAAGRS